MKSFLDFEEKSVEKAVQKACTELKIAPEKLKYDIISHGSSGIFGLVGAKKALIRVSVSSSKLIKKAASAADHAGLAESDAEIAASTRESVSALVDEAFGAPPAEIETPADTAAEAGVEIDEGPPDEGWEAAIAVAEGLIRAIVDTLAAGSEVTVETSRPGRRPRIHIRGRDAGMLIGKKGQHLEAIQYLVDKVVNKQCNQANPVIIDIENYLDNRKAELKELALRMAQKAQGTGKPAILNRMNAQDRRVVHMILKNNKSVRTQSMGSGYYRKLIIYPKKKAARNQKEPPTA